MMQPTRLVARSSHHKLVLGLERIGRSQDRISVLDPDAATIRRQHQATMVALSTLRSAVASLVGPRQIGGPPPPPSTLSAMAQRTYAVLLDVQRDLHAAPGSVAGMLAACDRAHRTVLGRGLALERALATHLGESTDLAAMRMEVIHRSNARVRLRHGLGRALLHAADHGTASGVGRLATAVATALFRIPPVHLEPAERDGLRALCRQAAGLRRTTARSERARLAAEIAADARGLGLTLCGQLTDADPRHVVAA